MSPGEASVAAAQAYEDHLVGPLFAPWARRVIDLAEPRSGELVLDVACGTGIGARLAAPSMGEGGGRIISVDGDAGMIEVAEKVAGASGLPGNVVLEWHVKPAEQKLAEDGSVDLCLCLQGPQFLSDPPLALTNIRSALKQNGRLAASMWNELTHNKGHYAIAQALQKRGVPPAMKPFSKGRIVDARRLIAEAELEIEHFETAEYIARFPSIRAFVDGVAAGAPATRHAIAQLSETDKDGFLEDVENTLAPYNTDDGVDLPTSAHLIVAFKREYSEN